MGDTSFLFGTVTAAHNADSINDLRCHLNQTPNLKWMQDTVTELSFKPLDGFRSDNQLLHGLLSKTGIDKGQFMWQRDPRTALNRVHQQEDGSTPDSKEAEVSGLKAFLSSVHDNPEILNDQSSAQIMAKEIARQASIYTTRGDGEETNLALSLQDLGVDSLVSTELRNWWKQTFGADVTVLQLMNGGNFMDLGQKALDQLKKRHRKT